MVQFQLNISKKLLEQIMILKVAKIWANSGLKYSFSLKGVFSGKLTVITYVYLVSHMILQHFKNILKANHQISGCMILVQNGSKFPVYPRKDYFAKWSIIYLLYFSILQYFKTNSQRANHQTDFCPNCPLSKLGFVFEN